MVDGGIIAFEVLLELAPKEFKFPLMIQFMLVFKTFQLRRRVVGLLAHGSLKVSLED